MGFAGHSAFWFFSFWLLAALSLAGCVQPEAGVNATNATPVQHPANCSGSATIDLYNKGNASANGTLFIDSCASGTSVVKFYCSGSVAESATVSCPQGYSCMDGACVRNPPANRTGPPAKCLETGLGKDFYTAGSVTYYGVVYNDTCQGSYDLNKYYCENDSLKQVAYHCPTGDRCEAGACVQMGRVCTDSDSANQSQVGITTLYGGGVVISTKEDYCVNSSTVMERDCANGSIVSVPLACPRGAYCYGASCVPLCQQMPPLAGDRPWVLANGTAYGNRCLSNGTLQEYSCQGNALVSGVKDCGNYCYEGKCLADSEVSCRRESYGVDMLKGSDVIANVVNLCLDFRTAKDFLCDNNRVASVYKACGDNELCQSGTCVQITGPGCYEMNGEDVHEKSGVAITAGSYIFTESENYCFNDRVLGQYTCNGTDRKFDYVTCPDDEKCSDGVCVYNYTCSETAAVPLVSPGGVSLHEGTRLVRSEKDMCTSDPSTVQQVSCDESGRIAYALVKCPAGTRCDSSSGVCK